MRSPWHAIALKINDRVGILIQMLTLHFHMRWAPLLAVIFIGGCASTADEAPREKPNYPAIGVVGEEGVPLAGQPWLGGAIGHVEFTASQVRGFFTDGTQAYRLPLDNQRRADGMGEWWYPGGELCMRTRYLQGRKHGRCQAWAEDGSLISDEVWYMGVRMPQNEMGMASPSR
jgi:hypothetical protein